MKDNQDAIKLKVCEGMVSDAHKGIVRILADAMKQLGLSSGDAVEVEGKRCTLARVLPAFSDSCSVGSIQMMVYCGKTPEWGSARKLLSGQPFGREPEALF